MRNSLLLLVGICLLAPNAAIAELASAPIAQVAAAQAPERKEIRVSEKVLKSYVGVYELTPERTLTITLEEGSLRGQPTDQEKRQLFAESETKFFLKEAPVEVTFQKEKDKVVGLLLKQGERPERELKKIK